ncbi:hypothetical protein MPER_05959, partial [Moniliophthora perniciosa FA553]
NLPMHEYVPGNMNDPLDVEVALVVNSIAHGLLIERVDPPLKKVPKDNEEIKAQSGKGASSGTTTTTKKVMCRVGGVLVIVELQRGRIVLTADIEAFQSSYPTFGVVNMTIV